METFIKRYSPVSACKPERGFFREIRILGFHGYIAGGRGEAARKFSQKFLRKFRSFPVSQYIAVRKDKSLSETEVLQMQAAMREPVEHDVRDEEIIDILIAISVVSKRLAEKLRKLHKKETTT